jgi:hypothetical protein
VIRPAMTCEQAHRLIGHAAFRLTDCFCCIFFAPSSRAYIMKRTRRQGRLLIALAGKNGPFTAFCAQIGRAATQKGQKFLLIVDFMPNLSDAFFVTQHLKASATLFGAVCFCWRCRSSRWSSRSPWCQWKSYLCELKRFRVCLHWEQSSRYSVM